MVYRKAAFWGHCYYLFLLKTCQTQSPTLSVIFTWMISWAQCNRLQVHPDKTVQIVWSGTPPELFLKEETISSVDDVKDLGVYIDKNLNWTSPIDCKLPTSYRQLYNVKRNVPYNVPMLVKIKIYLSCFLTILLFN